MSLVSFDFKSDVPVLVYFLSVIKRNYIFITLACIIRSALYEGRISRIY